MEKNSSVTKAGPCSKAGGRFITALLLFTFLSLFSVQLLADTLRCGRKLIRSGDSGSTVLKVCGQPRFKDSGFEKISSFGRSEKLKVKRWYYKSSKRRLERIVLLYRGEVVAIKIGDR